MTPEKRRLTDKLMDVDQEKTGRINVIVTERQRELIKQASAVTGNTMSEFIMVPAVERAASMPASEQVTRLTPGKSRIDFLHGWTSLVKSSRP